MSKKIHNLQHAVDYAAAIIVVLIQMQIIGLMNNFIEDIFGSRIFGLIIPLLSVITYSLHFGNSRLSFMVGFLSTIVPLVNYYFSYSVFIPQTAKFLAVFGTFFGLIGILFSTFKRNAGIATRISINVALFMSLFGIPSVLSSLDVVNIAQILIFWSVFNSALIFGLLLSYLILGDVKKAFIFSVSALIMTLLMIIITPLYSAIYAPYKPPVYFLFGIIIAIILCAILKVHTYYQGCSHRKSVML